MMFSSVTLSATLYRCDIVIRRIEGTDSISRLMRKIHQRVSK